MVDWQTAFNILMGVGLSVGGWFARTLWDAVQRLAADLAAFRADVERDHVRKDDFRDEIRDMKAILTRIWEKLDNKADK